MVSELTTDDTLRAWKDLLQSVGWSLFWQAVEEEWGAEVVLARMERALTAVPRGDQEAINDTVQQIQVARREIQKLRSIPAAKITALTPKEEPKGPFAALRRTGSR